MSFLRRRFGGETPSSDPSPDATPPPEPLADKRLVSTKTLEKLRSSGSKRRNLWIFGLGGIFGIVVAAFFAGSNDMLDLSSLENMNMAAILEALPAGLVKDAQQITVRQSHSCASFGVFESYNRANLCNISRNEKERPSVMIHLPSVSMPALKASTQATP